MVTYPYRLSLGLRVIFCTFAIIFLLGVHGYLDNSFSTDPFAQKLALGCAIPVFIISLFSPISSNIEFHKHFFTVPSIFIPFIKARTVFYQDVRKIRMKTENNYTDTLIVYHKNKKLKINSGYCGTKLQFTFHGSDTFYDIFEELGTRFEQDNLSIPYDDQVS